MAAASHAVTIRLLGQFSVTVEGRAIPADAWGARRARQLVKLLALAPRGRLAVDQVYEALWPAQDPAALGAALRQACYLARRAVGRPDFLLARAGLLTLAPDGVCAVDSAVFEAAAAAARRTGLPGDYAAALDRYAGDLLPDDRYEDWALAHAERLRELANGLRRDLAALRERAGDAAAAAALWRRILADEPADEIAHVGLMGHHARRGERQRALRQYHALHERLRDELGVAPGVAARHLYAAILAGQYPPPPAEVAPVAPRAIRSLPTSHTALIGRTEAIAAVGDLLGGEARLLTLVGAGGCGKSRLALAVAESLLPSFADGAWWVGLAPLADGALIDEAIAQVLGVRAEAGRATRAALVAALRDRALLLVLDNAEHLRADCGALALALLEGCPGLRILATSRAALRVVGEQTWRVPSLAIPDPPEPGATLDALAANDAVRLFAARARLARADFALTAGNAAAVASICRQLEGLPLALELAAARLDLLGPGQLAARLGDAPGLLTGGALGLPDRQRTLRATLDWSYDLLAEDEARLLRHLAVFAGGWTLDAAEAVCAEDGADILGGLAGLVGHSLVQVEPGATGDEPRYRLLEPTRQYALARLVARGEEGGAQEAHARYFLAMAEREEPRLDGSRAAAILRRLRLEIDNVRAALGWFGTAGDPADGVRLMAALRQFWLQQGYVAEGRTWLNDLLPRAAAPPPLAAKGERALAHLALIAGDWDVGIAHGRRSDEHSQVAGDRRGRGFALNLIAMNLRQSGRISEAQPVLDQALAQFREVGDEAGLGLGLMNGAVLAFDRGEATVAAAILTAALPAIRAHGTARTLALALLNLAVFRLTGGDDREVGAALREAVELGIALDEQQVVIHALAGLADLEARASRPERAARLLGASQAWARRANLPTIHSARAFHERVKAAARAALGDAAFDIAHAAGAALALDVAIAEALDASLPMPGR